MITIGVSQTNLLLTSPGLVNFWEMFGWINCGFAVFNMMPLPPLDGWRLVKVFVPRWAERVQHLTYQYMWVTMVLLLV
jgi:Zn-dependent protease